MSQDKVNEYKKSKFGRRKNLKLEKKKKKAFYSIGAVVVFVTAILAGYYFGNKGGYMKGYKEGFMLAGQIYQQAAKQNQDKNVSTGSAVNTTVSGSTVDIKDGKNK